jgi:F0F1-type ATP synthase membrane subunit b/b'
MPYEARRSELVNIKQHNEALHAQVKQEMENIRSQASAQGRMMLQGGGV